jgi:tol-pal system protein YbgF
VQPSQAPVTAPGTPASSPVADLSQRVDTLERQLMTLTGQIEEQGFRLRQLEEKVAAAAVAPPAIAPAAGNGVVAPPAPADAGAAAAPSGDQAEATYRAAYAHVEARDYVAAEAQLKAFVEANPKHRRASHAQYWLGRSYHADGKLNLAAESFLANYQTNPRGERAPDSLLWLGRTLTDLKKPAEACRVLRELDEVYGGKMSSDIRDQTAKARATAKCTA